MIAQLVRQGTWVTSHTITIQTAASCGYGRRMAIGYWERPCHDDGGRVVGFGVMLPIGGLFIYETWCWWKRRSKTAKPKMTIKNELTLHRKQPRSWISCDFCPRMQFWFRVEARSKCVVVWQVGRPLQHSSYIKKGRDGTWRVSVESSEYHFVYRALFLLKRRANLLIGMNDPSVHMSETK